MILLMALPYYHSMNVDWDRLPKKNNVDWDKSVNHACKSPNSREEIKTRFRCHLTEFCYLHHFFVFVKHFASIISFDYLQNKNYIKDEGFNPFFGYKFHTF